MSDAPTMPPMGAPDEYDPDQADPSRWHRAWEWISPKIAIAAHIVRVVGPYLAFAAFALALVSIKGLEDNQTRDNNRAIAADIAACQVGNARLNGNLNGTAQALADLTELVVDRAHLDLGMSRPELEAVALEVARDALTAQPELQPRDCSLIPGVSAADIATSTTTAR